MIGCLQRLLARGEPVLSEATLRDAPAIAALHAVSFRRGWSDGEIERLLVELGAEAVAVTVTRFDPHEGRRI